jgi:glycosyltransferase involved in cell wall biosynthesis
MNLISVIMPTSNAEKWVEDTINSLIAQTYSRYELIVVDDGSKDDTLTAVRRKLSNDFKNNWRIVELGSNRGPSAARNAGLKLATGSWVQFLDSDDFLAPTKFELQMAYCASAPSFVAAVHSPWRKCYYDDGKVTWEGPMAVPRAEIKAPILCLVGGNRPLHSAGLTRRAVLEQIGGFDESLRFWECEEINFRIARVGRLHFVRSEEPCYLWRVHRDKTYIGGEKARYRSTPVALSWLELILRACEHRPLGQLGLSAADQQDILDGCTAWARLLYSQDRVAFRKFVAMGRQLGHTAPTNPKYASVSSRFVGYENAEAVAKLGRMPKTLVRKALQFLKLRPPNSVFDYLS